MEVVLDLAGARERVEENNRGRSFGGGGGVDKGRRADQGVHLERCHWGVDTSPSRRRGEPRGRVVGGAGAESGPPARVVGGAGTRK